MIFHPFRPTHCTQYTVKYKVRTFHKSINKIIVPEGWILILVSSSATYINHDKTLIEAEHIFIILHQQKFQHYRNNIDKGSFSLLQEWVTVYREGSSYNECKLNTTI